MGRDCNLYAFPEGQAVRRSSLDRVSPFIEVEGKEHSADRLLEWVRQQPKSHWMEVVESKLIVWIRRWGEDLTVSIREEEWEPPKCEVRERWKQIKEEQKRKENAQVYKLVKEELREKHRNQWRK